MILLPLEMGVRKAMQESSKYSELHQKEVAITEKDLLPILICSHILSKITGKYLFTSIQADELLWSLNYHNIYFGNLYTFININYVSYRETHIDFCDINTYSTQVQYRCPATKSKIHYKGHFLIGNNILYITAMECTILWSVVENLQNINWKDFQNILIDIIASIFLSVECWPF